MTPCYSPVLEWRNFLIIPSRNRLLEEDIGLSGDAGLAGVPGAFKCCGWAFRLGSYS